MGPEVALASTPDNKRLPSLTWAGDRYGLLWVGRTSLSVTSYRLLFRNLQADGTPLGAGPVELAAAASLDLPRHAGSIRNIANLYTRCRYAPEPPPVPELQEAVSEFRPTRKRA